MDTLTDHAPDPATADAQPEDRAADTAAPPKPAPTEIGGPKEAEPTRYGDWTVKGRCIDF